jgi:hypothetical protein
MRLALVAVVVFNLLANAPLNPFSLVGVLRWRPRSSC